MNSRKAREVTAGCGPRRRGAVLVKLAIMVPVIGGMAAIGIDLSKLHSAKNELQRAADAAALAAAASLGRVDANNLPEELGVVAQEVVDRNPVGETTVELGDGDLVMGRAIFESETHTYTWTGDVDAYPNAVEVTLRRTEDSPSGPVPMLFGRLVGVPSANITATARAALTPRSIAVVVDDGDDMNDDSQLIHEALSIMNVQQIWQDLGSPSYGTMTSWNSLQTLTGSNAAVRTALGLDAVPYPSAAGLGGSWTSFVSYVKNQGPPAYKNKYGLKTFMDYLNAAESSYTSSPALANTHQQPLYTVKQVVNKFIDYLERFEGSDQVSLDSFNSSIHYRVAMTENLDLIREKMNSMIAGYLGDTQNIGAGINQGRQAFTQGQVDIRASNRVIVLISDGRGRNQGDNYQSQTEHAVAEGMCIYTISAGYAARPGQEAYNRMQWIAEHASGRHLNIPPTLDVDEYAAELEEFFLRIRGPFRQPAVLIQ